MRLIASRPDVSVHGVARVQSSFIAAEIVLCGAIARIRWTSLSHQSLSVLIGESGLHDHLVSGLRGGQRILIVLHQSLTRVRSKIGALTDHALSGRSCRARWHEVLRPCRHMLRVVGRDLVLLLHRRFLRRINLRRLCTA